MANISGVLNGIKSMSRGEKAAFAAWPVTFVMLTLMGSFSIAQTLNMWGAYLGQSSQVTMWSPFLLVVGAVYPRASVGAFIFTAVVAYSGILG